MQRMLVLYRTLYAVLHREIIGCRGCLYCIANCIRYCTWKQWGAEDTFTALYNHYCLLGEIIWCKGYLYCTLYTVLYRKETVGNVLYIVMNIAMDNRMQEMPVLHYILFHTKTHQGLVIGWDIQGHITGVCGLMSLLWRNSNVLHRDLTSTLLINIHKDMA